LRSDPHSGTAAPETFTETSFPPCCLLLPGVCGAEPAACGEQGGAVEPRLTRAEKELWGRTSSLAVPYRTGSVGDHTNVSLAQPGKRAFRSCRIPGSSDRPGPFASRSAPRIIVPQRSGTKFTITSFPCHVWGFYPRDIAITWLRDGRVRTESTYSPLQRNPDGTFNLTLTYTFTPMDWDRGSILTCRVSHAALVQPLQEAFALAVACKSLCRGNGGTHNRRQNKVNYQAK
uniref:Ig-like domain-containing protein n=1 Tax=Chrysemys picta bellii TaxID=8478 RepID=A0A8C3FAM3_CHRPI